MTDAPPTLGPRATKAIALVRRFNALRIDINALLDEAKDVLDDEADYLKGIDFLLDDASGHVWDLCRHLIESDDAGAAESEAAP